MDSASSSPGPLKELTTSRARFISELGERMGALRQGLARMATLAEPTPELNAVRRRLHALAAAAEVLRFAAAAEALAGAEATLATTVGAAPGAPARERVARILDLLPSIVLGVPLELEAELDAQRHRALREPLSVLVYGDAALETLLHAPGPLRSAETHVTTDPEELLAWVGQLGPDVLLIDADAAADASDLLPRIHQAAGARVVPVVAVGSFEQHEPLLRLVRRGVSRLQPQPVDAGTLQRTLRQVSPSAGPSAARTADFRKLTAEQLIESISSEARKAFTDPSSKASASNAIDFGSGAEVLASLWGAFARIRGLAADASEGLVSFTSRGPHGVVPLAPTAADTAATTPSASRTVSLAGRRFIVVDDDADTLALVSRALSQLGAVVLPARDATLALELAEQHWPDAVITDTLLPGMDGFELCQRIRDDIALADLPVALVAWREHLHALALEPRSIALALEACLLERANLERRLASHPQAHGRIDGLTPRLLLQLVCSRAPNALLILQSGRLRCELAVVDGRPVHAQLYDDGHRVAEGQAALGPLLGIRAGRFSVRPLFAPPAAHFSGDLMTVLAPAIKRARRMSELLRDGALSSVERVVLDAHAVAHYLEEAPGSQRSLVARLEEGAPPRSLGSASEAPGSGEPPRVLTVLLELSRRGAVRALLDRQGHDLLLPGSTPAAPLEPSSRSAPPSPPNEALGAEGGGYREPAPVMALGEAVFQAVSAPKETPSAARAHRGLAAPEASPPLPEPASEPAASAPAASAPAPTSSTPTSLSVPMSSPLPPSGEPREVPEAWSSEPEDDDEPLSDEDVEGFDDPRGRAESADAASLGARARSIASPLLVTLAAATLAFLGIRAVAGGGWQTLSAALQGPPPPLVDAGATRGVAPAPRGTPEAKTSEDLGLLAEQRKVPVDVTFTSELLDLPPHMKVRPGHGLLEVHTWEPQRIYVDGVFMGNYESRLIPLGPGTYQLRLRDGARDMERPVQVEAGRRTRLSARPKSSK